MGHAQMLETRRRKQKAKKQLAGAVKRAKTLTSKSVKRVGAGAREKPSG